MVKPPVSVLQEYCSRKKIMSPNYDYMNSDSGFVCQVELLDHKATGIGRSKRDAKHQAAGMMIKLLRRTYLDIDIGDDEEAADTVATAFNDDDIVPTTDMIMTLRDLCVKNNHPLPQFEIVQQGGTPNGPEFTAMCQVSSVRRYATSENKKDAKQKVALKLLRILTCSETKDGEQAVSLLNTVTPEEEERRFQKFKTYFELVESEKPAPPHTVPLCDRHNYFTKFHDELKAKAFAIIEDKTDVKFATTKEKALAVLDALILKPKIEDAPTISEPMLMITLDCDYDAVFLAKEEEIWSEIISYFDIMLR